MINIEVFDSNKTLIFTTLDTSQLKKIGDYENIYSVNPLYLIVNHASGYIKEKKWKSNTWFLVILLMKTKHY